ncbi:MAG TPA: NUDIX domain-containing protein [Ktedonobacterales bacterium]
MSHRVGVFATICDARGWVLLCHRRDCDFWCQPGGGLEAGETPWEGVAREVREETGLEVCVERLAGIYSWPTDDELILSFVCVATGGALTASDESSEVAYFPPNALPANTFAEHAARIADALAGHAEVMLCVPTVVSANVQKRCAPASTDAR